VSRPHQRQDENGTICSLQVCVCVCGKSSTRASVWERERKSEWELWESVCLCVSMCYFMCMRERERKRNKTVWERVCVSLWCCVYVCVCLRVRVYMYEGLFVCECVCEINSMFSWHNKLKQTTTNEICHNKLSDFEIS
jgi:hypothetical protein